MSAHAAGSPVVALVVAAGSGSRLGGDVPKALRPVGGVPLVLRSVRQLAAGGVSAVIAVVPEGLGDEFAAALASAPVPCRLVAGGAQRQDSVANGLALLAAAPELSDHDVVLVHDAARAFVPSEVVARVIEAVRSGADAVVPVAPVVDTIRQVGDTGSAVVDRSRLRAVQTPQGFRRAVLQAGHEAIADFGAAVTDDAAAAEFIGHPVTLVDGDRLAFKVTEPLDLLMAEALAAREVSA